MKSKQTTDVLPYQNDPLLRRNKEVWRLHFCEYWTFKDIAKYFDVEVAEIKKIIANQKKYYEQFYG